MLLILLLHLDLRKCFDVRGEESVDAVGEVLAHEMLLLVLIDHSIMLLLDICHCFCLQMLIISWNTKHFV